MRFRFKAIIGILVITIALCLFFTYKLITWTLWYSLSADSNYRLVVKAHDFPLELEEGIKKSLPEPAAHIIQQSKIVALQKKEQDYIYVVQPGLFGYLYLRKYLNQAGYQATRSGPFLCINSQSEEACRLSLFQSFRSALQAVVIKGQPYSPAVIASFPGEYFGYNSNAVVIGTRKLNGINLSLSSDFETESATYPEVKENLQVSIQSDILSLIPLNIREIWNISIQEKMGFKNTSPDLIGLLLSGKNASFNVENQGFNLAYEGEYPEKFIMAFEELLQNEERYSRPARRGFKTPDGILGYEVVPGEAEPIFHGWLDSCLAPIEGRATVWICRQGNRVVVGGNQVSARAHLDDTISGQSWLVNIPDSGFNDIRNSALCQSSETIPQAILCQLHSAVIIADHNRIQSRINF